MSDVLILSTAHGELGATGGRTGVWMEELAVPYRALRDAGHDVTVATLDGAPIPVDPNSVPQGDDADDPSRRFMEDEETKAILARPARLADQDPAGFDAVYVPGGHGAVWDLASSEEVASFLSEVWANGKILASVCHGPAALVNVEADGAPLVKDRKVSAFTDSEERGAGLQDAVPFLLETRLRELGADVRTGPDMRPHAIHDGRLITGQNPMSSQEVARLMLERLS